MRLNPDLNVRALRRRFQRDRRAHIGAVLVEEDAKALFDEIVKQDRWNFVIFANNRHIDMDAEGWRTLDSEKKKTTEQIVYAQAEQGFAYMYDTLPIYDRYYAKQELAPQLRALFEFLNGAAFLNLMRTVTGAEDIAFADAQLTRYGKGHFLTSHDDDVEGKNRRAAFVLNMTPKWREDWGGYLNFFNERGHVESAYKPAFNALNIFAVPAAHSVGYVAPFAAAQRYSITGWLRAGHNPATA